MAEESQSRVHVDARNLRGIAHPLRVRILGMLRSDGSATATGLAERLGLNTGATSYHLRQLAEYGFVVEDAERGTGRERWWKAAHKSSTFDNPEMLGDDQGLGLAYLRAIGQVYTERITRVPDEAPTLPEEWRAAIDFSDYMLRLTPEEARQLSAELLAVLRRYRMADDETAQVPPGAVRVIAQYQTIPMATDLEPEAEEA